MSPLSPQPPRRRQNDSRIDSLREDFDALFIRMARIETEVRMTSKSAEERAVAIGRLHADLNELKSDFDLFVNGNGKPGAKLQVDRIEERMKLMSWVSGIIVTVLIGQLVAALARLIIMPMP